eukprot:2432757-Lingulodinium_polyedra.AAC.1
MWNRLDIHSPAPLESAGVSAPAFGTLLASAAVDPGVKEEEEEPPSARPSMPTLLEPGDLPTSEAELPMPPSAAEGAALAAPT